MKRHSSDARRGFTLIEVIVVVAIFLTLITLTITNPLNLRESTSINAFVYTLITDIKNQQIKSMVGDTEGRGIPDTYSIYIEPTKYTLFHGQNYSESDSSNFAVTVDNQYQFLTTFPSNKIVFASGSGEIVGFAQNQNTITIKDARTGQQKVITINKFGVATGIN